MNFKNTKELFKYSRRQLHGFEDIGPLEVIISLITNDTDKLVAFSEFFASVFVQPAHTGVDNNRSQPAGSHMLELTISSVLHKLTEVKEKCSSTPDHLPPLIFKRLADVLAEPLSMIFKRSYNSGEVPKLFRESIVTPVFKKGSKSIVDNYRPIAQGCIASIVFEKILVDYIFDDLISRNLLDRHQHGFIKVKSTVTQLIEMTHN